MTKQETKIKNSRVDLKRIKTIEVFYPVTKKRLSKCCQTVYVDVFRDDAYLCVDKLGAMAMMCASIDGANMFNKGKKWYVSLNWLIEYAGESKKNTSALESYLAFQRRILEDTELQQRRINDREETKERDSYHV